MKYGRYLVYLILVLVAFINNINAECDYKTRLEINTSASNVQTNLEYYEKLIGNDGLEHPEATGKTNDVEGIVYSTFVDLNISNISDNIYLRIINEEDELNETIYASDVVDGIYKYHVPDTAIIRTYTIKVYSNASECMDEDLRTITVKTPMHNYLHGTDLCKNNDAYYCSEYITTEVDADYDAILAKKNNNFKDNETKIEEKESKNYLIYYIIGGIVIIIIIILIIVVIVRKRKKNKEYMRQSV